MTTSYKQYVEVRRKEEEFIEAERGILADLYDNDTELNELGNAYWDRYYKDKEEGKLPKPPIVGLSWRLVLILTGLAFALGVVAGLLMG